MGGTVGAARSTSGVDVKELIGDYEEFIAIINSSLVELGIKRNELSMMDHVCYRVETDEQYTKMVSLLSEKITLIGENKVSGRMIATFEFNEYPQVDSWVVPFLEMPAPKSGSPYSEGLEHAEVVVIGSLSRFLEKHTDLPFSLKGMSKVINPEAVLKLANGYAVKFHEQQLGAVVRVEKALEGKGV